MLSASHGDWLASPGPAANHGCYHGAGRDPIAIPPSIFRCLLRYYPIVRASSLFDFAQWASRVESSHGGCSRPAGCFETGGAPEDRGLDELNIIHSGRQRSLRLTSRKIVTDTIIMRLRCAVPNPDQNLSAQTTTLASGINAPLSSSPAPTSSVPLSGQTELAKLQARPIVARSPGSCGEA